MAVAKEHELQCAPMLNPFLPLTLTPSQGARASVRSTPPPPRRHAAAPPSAPSSSPSTPPPSCRCDDLFGFIFEGVLDANAVKQVTTHKGVLAKLYKSSGDKKKTQKFMLECVQKLVTESPHAGVRHRAALGA